MAQWVKNPIAVAWVAVEVQVLSPAWHSGLKDWHCCSCSIGCSYSLDSISGLGTFHTLRVWPLKKFREFLMAQWVKDLALSLLWLRLLGLIPGLWISTCCRCGKKIPKKIFRSREKLQE